MENHVSLSYELLDKLPYPEHLKQVPFYAGCHHEKLNGGGYPNGYSGDQLPLQARIIAIADVFEGLTAPDIATVAKKEGYKLTSHCDVHIPNSIEHIRGCIETLGVERIDHGLNAIEDDRVVQQLIDKNIALTGCPTRYAFQLQTSPDDLAMMTGLLERGVVISLSSDDPAQFGSGWLSQTLVEAQRAGNLSWKTMTKFMRNGFISAWLPSDRKTAYLQKFDACCAAVQRTQ